MIAIFLAGVSYKATSMTDSAFINTMFEIFGDNIVFIDSYKSDKSCRVFGLSYDKVLHYESDNISSWKKQYKYAKDFIVNNNIDTFIIFKPLMMDKMKYNDMYQYELFKRRRKEKDDYGFKYATIKNVYNKSLLIEAASKVCKKCLHFVVDPQEPNFESVYKFNDYREVYFLAKNNKRNCTFMPCCEYGLKNIVSFYANQEKVLDFTFHCGALTDDRKYILDNEQKLKSVKNSSVKILKSGKDFIKQEDYYSLLAQSKFTLCIKPYDVSTFSMLRWWEAFYLNCIPLIVDI